MYAKDKGPAEALEYERENWGTGSQVTTTLVSPAGEVSVTVVSLQLTECLVLYLSLFVLITRH